MRAGSGLSLHTSCILVLSPRSSHSVCSRLLLVRPPCCDQPVAKEGAEVVEGGGSKRNQESASFL